VLAAPHGRSDGAPASPLRYSAPRVFDTGFPARPSPTRRRGRAARAGSDGARWELRARRRRSARTSRSSTRWPSGVSCCAAGEGARGMGSRVRGLQPAAAARLRGRVRL